MATSSSVRTVEQLTVTKQSGLTLNTYALGADASGIIVTEVGTQTLTNKTILDDSNQVRASYIGAVNADKVEVSGIPEAGYTLQATSQTTATWAPGQTVLTFSQTTLNATPVLLDIQNTAANSTYLVSFDIAAKNAAGDCAVFKINNGFIEIADASTLAKINSQDDALAIKSSNASSWASATAVDTTNGRIQLSLIGAAGSQVNWKVTATVTAVTYA